jgi:DNA-binding GntR family transcriptional regulator
MPSPTAALPRKQTCIADLRRRILLMQLAPGAELEESSVAATYGLSRTPLREVYQQLAGEGYVTLQANRGARVVQMDLNTIRRFFQTAPLVLSSTARMAALNCSAEQLQELLETQGVFMAAIEAQDAPHAALRVHEIYHILGRASDNPYLRPALNRLMIDLTRLSLGLYNPHKKKERKQLARLADLLDMLCQCVGERDADQAAQTMLELWELTRIQMDRFLQPDPLPLVAGQP